MDWQRPIHLEWPGKVDNDGAWHFAHGRAMDGDIVVIEVLPESQWKRESTRLPGARPGKVVDTPADTEAATGADEEEEDGIDSVGAGASAAPCLPCPAGLCRIAVIVLVPIVPFSPRAFS